MRRRHALFLIVATLILFAVQAHAQEPVHRVGVLSSGKFPDRIKALEGALRERGYVVGQNLQIEYRFFEGHAEQIPARLGELIAFGPEILVTSTSNSAVVIHATAPAIPMVFLLVADPVGLGLVKSLAHPGGNVTGFATLDPQAFVAKHFQLLKTAVPGAARIAVVINPTTAMHRLALQKLPEVEQLLGVKLIVVEASKPDQFDAAFKTAKDQGAEAIDVWNDPLVYVNSKKIISLAEHYRIPAIYWDRVYVEGGGLMSYSPDAAEFWRRAAVSVDKILKGEKPGDLPVEQPSRYYLVLNLKTANALGITIPPSFLAQADEVIE